MRAATMAAERRPVAPAQQSACGVNIGGVLFDIAARGMRQQVSWTAATSNAWLALDRNGNGVIDNGAELFGNVTPQPYPPNGQSRNGFLALAVFDQPENGGNGDGLLNDEDSVYPKLLLWQDKNHDGLSQPEELKHLSDFGIAAIDLRYQLSNYTGAYGNIFRYRSKIYRSGSNSDGRWANFNRRGRPLRRAVEPFGWLRSSCWDPGGPNASPEQNY